MAPERTLPQFLLLELKIIYFRELSFGGTSGSGANPPIVFAVPESSRERKICIIKYTARAGAGGVGGMADPSAFVRT